MMLQQASNETNIKLPVSFVIYSLVAFVASQLIILFAGSQMIDGVFRTPAIWSAAHLIILGWALMVAMGSMYQLVPVAFLTPIWNERFGFFQFWISAIGVTTFAISLWFFPKLMIYTGMLAVVGILLFVFQMFMTMRKQAKKNILTLFVGSALFCLFLTISLGLLLAINLGAGISGLNHLAILKSHILLGITGWFTLLIFGFSYKMVPMFSLAHGFSMKLSKWVYSLYMLGLGLTFLSFFMESRGLLQAGLTVLFMAFGIFFYHILTILKSRLKKKLDRPFFFSLCAIGFGAIIHGAGMVLSFFPTYYTAFGLLIYLYLFCWVVFSIIGYLYKIVPFLWWTHRYSKLIGKQNVPTLKEMMNEELSLPIFYGLGIGVICITLASIFSQLVLFYISQTIILGATILFTYVIFDVLRK